MVEVNGSPVSNLSSSPPLTPFSDKTTAGKCAQQKLWRGSQEEEVEEEEEEAGWQRNRRRRARSELPMGGLILAEENTRLDPTNGLYTGGQEICWHGNMKALMETHKTQQTHHHADRRVEKETFSNTNKTLQSTKIFFTTEMWVKPITGKEGC